ncbi:Bug family tripartite tricarboxylate transporter substrate binding protein [Azospirillum halopraeferens]|uniref:Bug family tripartite tricarboxylate transporter substrate binding protein n=1 Tax=Azospirillum halopraeferens TaxID=34010 RepID=UPI00040D552A|nr:tripartite tricarboxylate transporter substrate binding protein [Azospirillum halopraeferens]
MDTLNPETRLNRRSVLHGLAGTAAVALSGVRPGEALAATFPSKRITAIVPFGAGGGSDTQTRIWGEAIAPLIDQRVVVENVAGSAGVAGTKRGIAADPDGHTVVVGAASTIAINPFTNKAADYNPSVDLQPVALLGYTPYVLVVANDLKIRTLAELIEYGKEHDGKLTHAGWTAVGELARKGLELRTGLKMRPVPYKGSMEAITDVIAGRASASIVDISTAIPFTGKTVGSGSVTPILMTGPDKSSALPWVQTTREAGLKDYVIDSWTAVFVPRKTPADIVEFLNTKTRQALKTENVKARYADLEIEQRDYDVDVMQAFIARQISGWKALIEEIGSAD